VPAYDVGEKKTVERLTKLFEAAKFEIQKEMDLGDRPRWDLIVTRQELGRYRKFVVDLSLTKNPRDPPEKFAANVAYARSQKSEDIDEYWVVSNLSLANPPRVRSGRAPNVRFFTIKELERMLARLNPRSRGGSRAKTKIGRAIEANEKSILLAIEALKLQIDDKIAKLADERPNDPDAVKKRDASIAEFEAVRDELDRIKVAVQQFKKNGIKEKEVVETVHAFKESLGKWWQKSQDTIYASASNSAMFVGATGVLHAIGADGGVALAIVGSLIGGKSVAEVLKSLPRGLFKKDH